MLSLVVYVMFYNSIPSGVRYVPWKSLMVFTPFLRGPAEANN